MAHVPGYEQDVFVSYAHGDDSEWVHTFVYKLKSELKSRGVEANIWIDRWIFAAVAIFAKKFPMRSRLLPRSFCSHLLFTSGLSTGVLQFHLHNARQFQFGVRLNW